MNGKIKYEMNRALGHHCAWRSEADLATSRSRRLPTILNFMRGWGRNILVSFNPPRSGTEPRTRERQRC